MSKMEDSDSSDAAQSATSQHGVTVRRPQKMRRSTEHDPESPDIIKYNVKVPAFSPEDPEIWFAILEGQFDNYGITDDVVKFNNVLTKLDIPHAKAVKDIIVNPPSSNRYGKIKSELIRRLTASHEKKVRQLLTHEEIGDRKASEFLRHLRDLAGPNVPEEFLLSIWSNRLPRSIQTVLASQTNQDLEQLADLADRIQEITTPSNVAAASVPVPKSEPSSASVEIAELKRMVERLAIKLDEHTRESRSRRRNRSDRSDRAGLSDHSDLSDLPDRHRSSSRSMTRSASVYHQYPICWYHATYGSRARKCQTPCDYKRSGNATGNHQ